MFGFCQCVPSMWELLTMNAIAIAKAECNACCKLEMRMYIRHLRQIQR